MVIHLYRTYEKEYTKGRLETPFGTFFTIERPNKDNIPRVSCIPEGVYKVTKSSFFSGKNRGKKSFRLHDVPNRSGILIHIGNYVTDVVGCISPGLSFNDTLQMVQSSAIAFRKLWDNLPPEFQIEIKEDKADDMLFWKDWEQTERYANQLHTIYTEPLKPKKQASNRKKTYRNLTILAFAAFLFKLLK